MYYIYVLFNSGSNKYYVGHSSNPWNRLAQHNIGDIRKFTGKYSDWELKAVFEVSSLKSDADKMEKFIKCQKSRILIEKLIDPKFIPSNKLAQLVRVPHVRD